MPDDKTTPVSSVGASLGGLSSSLPSSQAVTSVAGPVDPPPEHHHRFFGRSATLIAGIITLIVLLLMGAFLAFARFGDEDSSTSAQTYKVTNLSLSEFAKNGELSIDKTQQLQINGQLRINNSAVISPGDQPAAPVTGQLYLAQSDNQLYYYDGTNFVNLADNGQKVASLGGLSGDIALGSGLSVAGGVLSSTVASNSVISVQGQTGAVSFTAGGGIAINGLTIANTGVTGISGTAGHINVSQSTGSVVLSLPQSIATTATPSFAGLNLGSALTVANGGTGGTAFTANGVVLGNGSGALITTSSGTAGQCFRSNGAAAPSFQACPGGGGGDISSGTSQTAGTLTKFDSVFGNITDSLVSELGATVSVNGDLDVVGTVSGDGSGLANVDAAQLNGQLGSFYQNAGNLNAGTLSDLRLSTNVTLQGNTFNGASQLVQLNASTQLPAVSGVNVTNLNASNVTSGTLGTSFGGTGAGSFTTNGVLYGNNTGALLATTAGSTGQCLMAGVGGVPSFQACPVGGNISSGTSQTAGALTKFDATTNQITDSLLSESAGTITASGNFTITGTPRLSALSTGILHADASGNVTSSLVNLGTEVSGTLSDARLSANVALLNAAQTFTGANTFNNASNSFTGDGTGLINVNAAQLNGQIGSFYQNAGNINAGTLGVGFGGTGQTSYTDGQLLIGNTLTGGLSKATLTAGSGITITNGNGTITISSPASGTCAGCANVTLSNLSSPTAINQSLLTDGSTTIDLGSTTNAFRDLYLNNQLSLLESGATPSFRGSLAVADLGGNQSYTLNEGGTVVTSGNVASYATTGVTAGSGLTGGGTTGSLTLNVVAGTGVQVNANDIEVLYGAIAGTAVQGNTQATVTAGTNLTGGGTITLGSGGSVTVNTVNNPTFSTSVTTPLLNLTNSGFTGALQPTTLTANQTYTLPNQSGTVCLSTGNCPSGGNISSGTAQTAGNLVKFDTTTNEITNSIASESGSKITVAGTLDVTGASTITLGAGSSNSGSLLFKNSTNNNTLTLQSGATASNLTFTLPTADGGNGECLKTNASGVLSFGVCLSGSGAGGGVTSLNSLSGSLSLANASGSGSTITIDNASTSAKGIAQFNATNFSASNGTINTIQDIALTSSPTFASTTFNSNLRVLEDGGTPSFYGSFNVADLSADQTYTFNEGGNVITSGNVANNAVTNVTAGDGLTGGGGPGSISLAVGAGAGITVNANDIAVIYGAIAGTAVQGNTQMTVTAGTNLSGGGTVTLGSGGTVTVNTVNNPTFSTSVTSPMLVLTGAGSNGTLQVASLGQATTYTLPDPGAASATICLSTGNCAGAGGGITGSGTAGALAKFTSTGVIGDSLVSESGSAVTVSGTLAVTGASTVTLGSASNTGSLLFKNSSNSNTLTLQSGATGSNLTFTLPTADGGSGQCLKTNASGVLSFGDCLSGAGGGGGGVVSLNGLSGSLSLANASGSGSTVTIDNASTSAKGIAQFNATNFSASNGTINTIQDIATTSSPTFATLTANTELRVLEDGATPTLFGTFNVADLTVGQTYTFNEGGNVITSGNVASNATTGVTAGSGLTGGGTTGVLTVNVGAGNGITVNPNDITLALQANKGLEVDANGLSLIDCADTEVLKYSTATNQWGCAPDAGGSGLGDNVSVNGSAAADANFLNVAATGTVTGTSWSLNTVSNPDDITVAISNASDTQAGAVTTGIQTFAGAKTFNGQIIAAAGIDLGTQTLAGTTAVINFTNFDVTSAGAVTAVGVDAGTGLLQNTGGLTTTGTASINTTGTAASSIGNATGALTLTGSSGSSFVLNGTTVTAAEFNVLDGGLALGTETDGNYVATITAGGGLTGDATGEGSAASLAVASANGGIVVNADNIQLTLQAGADALSSTTSSGSGLEILTGGITLLQGCSNGQILKWNETTDVWECAADGAGTTSNSFATINAPAGTDPVATSGTDTLNLAATGTNLTITGDSGTDTLTFDIDESVLAGNGITASGDALQVAVANGVEISSDAVQVNQNFGFAWTAQQSWTTSVTQDGALADFNLTLGNDADVDTVSAINIDVTSAATGDADVVYGLNVGNLTSANATVLERAIRVGSGWDEVFDINGTLISAAEFNVLDGGIDLGADTAGNYVATITAGNGLTGDATGEGSAASLAIASANGGIVVNADNIALTLQPTSDALSSTTSSGSGLEILTGGITLLQGCSNNQILKWNETTDVWACSSDDSGSGSTTLQNAYDNTADATAEIVLTSSQGTLSVQDATVALGTNLLEVTSNGGGTTYFGVAAASINLGADTTVAAGKTLTIVGGTTASKPASPTEGTMYYDQTLDQLQLYSNGKWQSDRTTATKIVAASNSQNKDKADYIADGTADQTEINAALSALPAAGGVVYLLEGTYTIDAAITMGTNKTLTGSGESTLIQLASSVSTAINAISGSSINNVTLSNFKLDGNKAGITVGIQDGINMNNVGSGSGTSAVTGARINKVTVQNFEGNGFDFTGGAPTNSTITDSVSRNNGQDGIAAAAEYLTISHSQVQANGNRGIYISDQNATASQNIIEGNTNQGIYNADQNATIADNKLKSNGSGSAVDGNIISAGGAKASITGNTSESGNPNGIYINSPNSSVSGNTIFSSLSNGIYLNTDNVSLTGNSSYLNAGSGILLSGNQNTVTGNSFNQNTTRGINLSGNYNSIGANTIANNTSHAIEFNTNASNNTFSSNNMYENATSTTHIISFGQGANNNQLIGNRIIDTTGTGCGIDFTTVNPPANTYLADNTFSLASGVSTLCNPPASTIFANQQTASKDLVLQGPGAVNIGQTAVGAGTLSVTGAYYGSQLSTPSTPTATRVGASGTATYKYKVTALDGLGETAASAESAGITNGAASLNATDLVRITFSRVGGATQYKVYRTTATGGSPTTTGLIGTITAGTATTSSTGLIQFDDTGLAATTAAPTDNTTGSGLFAGDLTVNGGDFTSSATTFNLLQTNVTTLNIGGAVGAGGINLAGGSGSTGCTLDGATGNFTCSGTISGGTATTLQTAYDLTADATAEIVLTSTQGVLTVQDATVALGTNLLEVTSNGGGTTYFGVSASTISLNVDTTVAANKVLTVIGGITANRPAGTTEGQIFYDQTLDQMLIYSNGKWQADRSTATKIVAASNSLNKEKADYVADGNTAAAGDGDQIEINQAISAVNAAGGGTVYLLEGTYTIDATIAITSNINLVGSGTATVITIPNTFNSSINFISESTNPTNIKIANMRLNGNGAQQSSGTMRGIYLVDVGLGVTSTGATIYDMAIDSFDNEGILLSDSSNSTVSRSSVRGNSYGIYNGGSSDNNNFSNNIIEGNTLNGIEIFSGVNATVTGNIIKSNGASGIYTDGTNGTFSGNTVQSNTSHGIRIQDNYQLVTGNTFASNGGDGISALNDNHVITGNSVISNTGNGIYQLSSYSSISGNTITGNTGDGIEAHGSYTNMSSNKIHNNGAHGIILDSGPDYSQVVGNSITDTTGTSNPIYVYNSDSIGNYLADNTFSCTSCTTVGGYDILNSGTGTIFGGQLNANNDFMLQGATRTLTQQDLESSAMINNSYGGIGQFGNLLTYSEQFDNGAWTKSGVTNPTADTIIAPDLQTSAETLVGTGNSNVQQTYTTTTNGAYTFSVWLKSAGTVAAGLRIDSTGATPATGTVKAVTTSTNWTRHYVTQTFTGTPSNIKVVVLPGNGATGTVQAWGAQLIAGTNPGAYVRSTASTISTSSGVVSNGGLFVSSINATDKPLVVQAAPGQSGNLFEVQNTAGGVLAAIDSAGRMVLPTLGAADTTTALCRNTSNQIATCSAGATGTLQQAYDNTADATAEIILTSSQGVLSIRDATSALGTNLLEVTSNDGATDYLAVTSAGITVGDTTSAGNVALHDGNGGQTTTIQAGNSVANLTFILPASAGNASECLKNSGTAGVLTFANCNNGSGSGGAVTLQDAYDASGTPASIAMASGKNLVITSQELAVDPNILINLECATCSANGGRFAVQDNGTDVFTVNPNGTVVLAGATTFNGGVTVEAGDTLTFNGDAFTDLTGIGLAVASNALRVQAAASADALSSTTSSGSGLEVLASGVALLQGCANGDVLKWNETTDVWECAADNSGSGTGDNISVNSSAATDANLLDVAATGTVTGTTWSLNTATNPDNITLAISNASDTVAGAVTTGTQTFAGDKTFNGLITANGNITLQAGDTLTINSDAFTDLTGNGLAIVSNALRVQAAASADALSATTSSGSGLEVLTSGVALLQGCANNDILKWNETTDVWACAADSTGAGGGDAFLANNQTFTGRNLFTGSGNGSTEYGALFKNASNSTTAFQIQPASSATPVFSADTTNSRIGIGTAAPSDTLEVVGNIVSKGTAWTSRSTTGLDNSWSDVAYGNGMFVAVSDSGTGTRVMSSPDGVNWTSRTSADDHAWSSITYGNGMFVAVACGVSSTSCNTTAGNRVMTSTDGITWTSRVSAADVTWSSVAYGNGLFVAVSDSAGTNRAMTSRDGVNWILETTGVDNSWNDVTYGNGQFVAVAYTGTGNRVMTSPDGDIWTARTTTGFDNEWRSITYGNGKFVAVASNGTNRVMTSPDGVTWTSYLIAQTSRYKSVTYGDGLYVAVACGISATVCNTTAGDRVITSPDGINWTSRADTADIEWESVSYGNGIFVAVAQTGTANRVMTSGKTDATVTSTNNVSQGGTTVYGSSLFKSDANSTTAFQIQRSDGAALLTADTTNGQLSVRGINSVAVLGSEKTTNGTFTGNATGWTLGTGWAYNSNNVTKTAGTASAMQQNVSAVNGETYKVTFTISAWSAGCITPTVGGVNGNIICYAFTTPHTETQLITATGTGNVLLNADSTFNGTIDDVSVTRVTESNTVLAVQNSDASVALEVRSGGVGLQNIFMGTDSGQSNLTGNFNAALGYEALQNNTSGSYNLALGYQALAQNTTGEYNLALGANAMFYNSTGSENIAIGRSSLQINKNGHYNVAVGAFTLSASATGLQNTAIGYKALEDNTSNQNTALGYSALANNTSGFANAAFGSQALISNTTGSSNVAFGYQAGITNTSGNANVSGSNNTYIGVNAGPGTSTQYSNATAIGANAIVSQSDSLVLGCISGSNTCSTTTKVGIGTATPSQLLDVQGTIQLNLASANTAAVCHSGTNGAVNDSDLTDCSGSVVADYAESYPVASGVAYGDIVAMGTTMINTYGENANGGIDWSNLKGQVTQLVKSSSPYQFNTIGIASDNHGDFTSAGHNIRDEDNPMPVALNGRVPVNISATSAPIQPGDYITTSNDVGKGMKATGAGYVVGKALAAWNPGEATVMVFVEPGYYPGPSMSSVIQNGGSASLSSLSVTGDASFANLNASGTAALANLTVTGTATIATLVVTGNATFQGDILVNGHIITGGGAPNAEVQVNAGTGATVTISGTDSAGTITITTGSTPSVGSMAKIIFAKKYGEKPRVVISPSNEAAGDLRFFKGLTTIDDFLLNVKDAPLANTTYEYDYIIAQ